MKVEPNVKFTQGKRNDLIIDQLSTVCPLIIKLVPTNIKLSNRLMGSLEG